MDPTIFPHPHLGPGPKRTSRRGVTVLLAVMGAVACGGEGSGPGAPTGLTVELLRFPERAVITDSRPELGWVVQDPLRGAVQSAYHVRVASSRAALAEGGADLWDSGRVESEASQNVEYGGEPLEPGTAAFWLVRTWDGAGRAGPWSEPQEFHTSPASLPPPAFPGQSRWVDLDGEPVLEDRQSPDFVAVRPVTVTEAGPGRTFVDFGRAAFGTLAFEASGPEDGATLTAHLGERREGDAVHKDPGTTNIGFATVEMALAAGQSTYVVELPRHHARYPHSQKLPEHMPEVVPFRYGELVTGGDVTVSSIEQRALFYPFDDDAAHFESSNPDLDRVWQLCRHTLKATPFLALYADGNRERMPYEADAYIQQLGHYAVDREYALARYTNQFLIWNPAWPTEWTMHAVLMAHADWMQTGNTDHLERNYEHLLAKALIPLAREDGLISTRTGRVTQEVLDSVHHRPNHPQIMTDIVDWPPGAPPDGPRRQAFLGNTPEGERDGYVFADYNTVVNAFHYRSLRMMADIAGALGKADEQQELEARVRRVRESFNETFFDEGRGVYVDGEGVAHASLHANMFPLAFGLVPEDRMESVVRHVESRGMACSVYGAQYLLEGLYAAGEAEYALSLMTSDSKRSWLNMLRVGATMTTEAWDEFYKPNLTWNHAWGSAPANIVARKIAGIEPAEPGFTRIAITPRLGGLERGDLRMPTPRGGVRVAWRSGADGLALDVAVPANTRAEIGLPPGPSGGEITESGEPLGTATGVEVQAARDGRTVVEVGGGAYSFLMP